MKKKKTGEERVKIIPLGGLEQIGMNITAFETEESIIVVDCGLAFPGSTKTTPLRRSWPAGRSRAFVP